MKWIQFSNYQASYRSDKAAFEQMLAHVERLSSLTDEEDQSNHSL